MKNDDKPTRSDFLGLSPKYQRWLVRVVINLEKKLKREGKTMHDEIKLAREGKSKYLKRIYQ